MEEKNVRERRGSYGNVEKMLKRKREEGRGGEVKEKEIFRTSKKTVRSPDIEEERVQTG